MSRLDDQCIARLNQIKQNDFTIKKFLAPMITINNVTSRVAEKIDDYPTRYERLGKDLSKNVKKWLEIDESYIDDVVNEVSFVPNDLSNRRDMMLVRYACMTETFRQLMKRSKDGKSINKTAILKILTENEKCEHKDQLFIGKIINDLFYSNFKYAHEVDTFSHFIPTVKEYNDLERVLSTRNWMSDEQLDNFSCILALMFPIKIGLANYALLRTRDVQKSPENRRIFIKNRLSPPTSYFSYENVNNDHWALLRLDVNYEDGSLSCSVSDNLRGISKHTYFLKQMLKLLYTITGLGIFEVNADQIPIDLAIYNKVSSAYNCGPFSLLYFIDQISNSDIQVNDVGDANARPLLKSILSSYLSASNRLYPS